MSACDWPDLPRSPTKAEIARRILAIIRAGRDHDYTKHDELDTLAGMLARRVLEKSKKAGAK